MAENVYTCTSCGGIMVFDIESQMLKCPNCENSMPIPENQSQIIEHGFTRSAMQRLSVQEKTTETKQCQGCGAMVEISRDCTATQCAYCGASYVLAERQEEAVVPDGVAPFQIDKYAVGEIFNKWIRKRWLAPNELKRLYESDKIQGIYVPYWTFDADVMCHYTAQGGKERRVEVKNEDGSTTTKTEVDWYHTSGKVKNFFDDVLVKATKNLKSSLLKGIEPYNTKEQMKSYAPEYLSGYGAECYSISLEDAHKDARSIMEDKLRRMAESDVRRHYDRVKDVRLSPDYKEETYKHVLLPVYSTAYTYKGKDYTVLINGQNGNISGDYPKSPVKIAIIVLVIIALLAGLFMLNTEACEPVQDENVYTEYGIETIDADTSAFD